MIYNWSAGPYLIVSAQPGQFSFTGNYWYKITIANHVSYNKPNPSCNLISSNGQINSFRKFKAVRDSDSKENAFTCSLINHKESILCADLSRLVWVYRFQLYI